MMKKYILALAAIAAFNVTARAENIVETAKVSTSVIDNKNLEEALTNVDSMLADKTDEQKKDILETLSKEVQAKNPFLFFNLTQEQKNTFVICAGAALALGVSAFVIYKYIYPYISNKLCKSNANPVSDKEKDQNQENPQQNPASQEQKDQTKNQPEESGKK